MSLSTFSKHPARYPASYPKVLRIGSGAYVIDDKGRSYLDWAQGLGGTGIFGHAHPQIFQPFYRNIAYGTSFHLPHVLEQSAADELLKILPGFDAVRFCLNGTDATAGAIRLARGATGRSEVIQFKGSYHGDSTADWSIAGKNPRGVYALPPVLCDWNDADGLRKAVRDRNPAAVIFEVNIEDPTPEFVNALNEVKSSGVVLVADEVVTGLRFPKMLASRHYGIHPDLVCLGKALGSGVPIAAVVGCDLMREFDITHTNSPVFMSFTHAGNAIGLAALLATLRLMQSENDDPIALIWESGRALMSAFGDNPLGAVAKGQPPRSRFVFAGDGEVSGYEQHYAFVGEMARLGILMTVANFPTACHDIDTVTLTRRGMECAFERMKKIKPGAAPPPLYTVRA